MKKCAVRIKLSVMALWQFLQVSGSDKATELSFGSENVKKRLVVMVRIMMTDNTTRCFGDIRLMQV